MRKTIGSITAAVAVTQLALVALAAPSLAAGADDDCLAKPNAAAPKGSHWYYRVERGTQRQCWYVGPAGKNVRRAERPAADAPVTDTEVDASATPPTSPAPRVEAAAVPSVPAMPPQVAAGSRDATAPAQSSAFGQRWSDVPAADAALVAAPQAAGTDTDLVKPLDPAMPAPAAVSSAGIQVDPPAAPAAEADQSAPSTGISVLILVFLAIGLGALGLGVRAAIKAWLLGRPARRGADWSAGWTAERIRAPIGAMDEASLAPPLVPRDAPVRPADATHLLVEPIGLREAEADLARLLRSVRRQRAA